MKAWREENAGGSGLVLSAGLLRAATGKQNSGEQSG